MSDECAMRTVTRTTIAHHLWVNLEHHMKTIIRKLVAVFDRWYGAFIDGGWKAVSKEESRGE